MGVLSDHSLSIVGVLSALVLLSSFSVGLLFEEDGISFSIDDDSIMNDIEEISSLGPRVTGSDEELEAAQYISDRFSEIGLAEIKIEEYQITGSWFVDAEPEDHQILMHGQLEQGAQNIPGIPDGSAGTARVEIDSTGDLYHGDVFTFLGYSGAAHKHDNILTDLGKGTVNEFSSAGDLTDSAIIINYDNQRSLAEIYKNSIDQNAAVVMIYTEGIENPPFRTVTVNESGRNVPFPDAYGGQYSDLLIPFIYISESTALLFHDFIERASGDSTIYPILDGFWEGSNVGFRTVRIVSGEIPGSGDGEIIIGAHHDSSYISPGAVNNAVGVAQLIEIATRLNELNMDSTIKFMTWGGSELGSLGSQEFLEENPEILEGVDLFINLDSTNLDPELGSGVLNIDVSDDFARGAVESARNKVMSSSWGGYTVSIAETGVGNEGDHNSFISAGIRSVGLYGEESSENNRQTDTLEIVNTEGLALTTEIILQLVAKQGGYDNHSPIIKVESLEGQSETWFFPFTIALMAGLSTGIGGLIVMTLKEISREIMAFTLGMAAGVMLLISVFDLWFERALEFGFLWISVSFILGAVMIVFLNRILGKNDDEINTEQQRLYQSGIFTAIALGIHNFPEGLAIGVAVLESAQYGLVLMVAIALHNIPEGIAVAAPIQAGGGGRLKATLIALATGLTEPLGALFALLVLGSILTPFMVGVSLAFVGGIMAVVSFTELIPQAIAQNRSRHMLVGMVFGAALMQLSLLLLG